MKTRATQLFSLFFVLALSLSVSAVYGKIGFAVSKYEVDVRIVLGSVQNVTFARVYNTGNETLTLKAAVQQSSETNGTLGLRLILEKAELKPDENCLVKVEIDATNQTGTVKIGNYTVQVEISPSANATLKGTGTGGAVLPSTSVDGKVVVFAEGKIKDEKTSGGEYVFVGLGLGFIIFLGICWWRTRNAKEQL